MSATINPTSLSDRLYQPPATNLGLDKGQRGDHGLFNAPPRIDLFEPPPRGSFFEPGGLDTSEFGVGSSEDEPVKGSRDSDELNMPKKEHSDHEDLDLKLNDDKTLKLRWKEGLGYVVIGEKHGDKPMKLYTEDKFKEINKDQLKNGGGGEIPPATTEFPEFFVPEQGGESLIYRRDPETGKDVIVGIRTGGVESGGKPPERHYFQSQATVDLVNSKAEKAGLPPPERPLTPPGDTIPADGQFHDGFGNDIDTATNGEPGKVYRWRYDVTVDRYCAVGESQGDGVFRMYDVGEYRDKNAGVDGLRKTGTALNEPVSDPGHPEMVDTTGPEIRFIRDPDAGTTEDGTAIWGFPVYRTDVNTGQRVCVGVSVAEDGRNQTYYFDRAQIRNFNETMVFDGHEYYKPKPFPEGATRAPEGDGPTDHEEAASQNDVSNAAT